MLRKFLREIVSMISAFVHVLSSILVEKIRISYSASCGIMVGSWYNCRETPKEQI